MENLSSQKIRSLLYIWSSEVGSQFVDYLCSGDKMGLSFYTELSSDQMMCIIRYVVYLIGNKKISKISEVFNIFESFPNVDFLHLLLYSDIMKVPLDSSIVEYIGNKGIFILQGGICLLFIKTLSKITPLTQISEEQKNDLIRNINNNLLYFCDIAIEEDQFDQFFKIFDPIQLHLSVAKDDIDDQIITPLLNCIVKAASLDRTQFYHYLVNVFKSLNYSNNLTDLYLAIASDIIGLTSLDRIYMTYQSILYYTLYCNFKLSVLDTMKQIIDVLLKREAIDTDVYQGSVLSNWFTNDRFNEMLEYYCQYASYGPDPESQKYSSFELCKDLQTYLTIWSPMESSITFKNYIILSKYINVKIEYLKDTDQLLYFRNFGSHCNQRFNNTKIENSDISAVEYLDVYDQFVFRTVNKFDLIKDLKNLILSY